ncbi:GNAT family N-acetyltransferase [Nosocomiicoccus ampullae]|uniref:GNAT family N-acetyltransferase n=1 Tax=Nosocomiicoccus ampullae TaxID=489910 RepID=UPI00254A1B96|nr:GNAT family N-acetyltransferase [Nosocomiicoccus ampullae]MDK6863250.1 GNAT family N-acetyltransferase [Nosocomiicoccus ampullae]
MHLNIRKMLEADIPDVQYVAKKSWNATYQGIIPEDVQNSFLKVAYSDEMLKKRLYQIIFVAEHDEKIIGFINLKETEQPNTYDLSAIYILPDYQGKRIGSRLIAHSIEPIKNFEKIFLEVEKDNINAVNFYRKLGFKIVDEYNDDFDGHILRTLKMTLSKVR